MIVFPNPTNRTVVILKASIILGSLLDLFVEAPQAVKPASSELLKEQIGKFPVFHDLLLFFQGTYHDTLILIKVFLDEWIQHHNRCC